MQSSTLGVVVANLLDPTLLASLLNADIACRFAMSLLELNYAGSRADPVLSS